MVILFIFNISADFVLNRKSLGKLILQQVLKNIHCLEGHGNLCARYLNNIYFILFYFLISFSVFLPIFINKFLEDL